MRRPSQESPAVNAEHQTRLEKVWADGKYHNHHLNGWLEETEAGYAVEMVNRPAGSKGFVLLHRRWVVERTFCLAGEMPSSQSGLRGVHGVKRSDDQGKFNSSHAQIPETGSVEEENPLQI
jgi:hypothetical protein